MVFVVWSLLFHEEMFFLQNSSSNLLTQNSIFDSIFSGTLVCSTLPDPCFEWFPKHRHGQLRLSKFLINERLKKGVCIKITLYFFLEAFSKFLQRFSTESKSKREILRFSISCTFQPVQQFPEIDVKSSFFTFNSV